MPGLLAALVLIFASGAQAACRQALALGLDVSGSVDAREYRLQLDGLAGALLRPDVQNAFLAVPGAPVELLVFEWAGLGPQRILIPWATIQTPGDLAQISATLANSARVASAPPTAIGQAMLAGARRLRERPECARLTLDLSGDGKSNTGPRPRDVKAAPILEGITVNALIIGPLRRRPVEITDLWGYFSTEVIRGPQAFVEVALGFEDFENAMARKLLKELQIAVVSENRPIQPYRYRDHSGLRFH